MSSMPPNTPPGANTPPGGNPPPPYPPYGSKTQWRAWRAQQKAAQRAQRDAWRAQRSAWKTGYAGVYGPHVPSIVGPAILVAIGVVGLLVYSGRIALGQFWAWYGRWWPLLFIFAGLAMLGEWALDMRRGAPVRRGGGYVGLLILAAIIGLIAAGTNRAAPHVAPWINQWRSDNDNFFNMFSQPQHDSDLAPLTAQIPANALVNIDNPRGDISVTAGDGSTIEVQTHELAFANSDSNAKEIFNAEVPHLSVNGSSVTVKSSNNDNGRINLTVSVPKSAHVTLQAGRGDVTVSGLGAGPGAGPSAGAGPGLDLNVAHGDTHLNNIAGPVTVHFSNGRGDFSAHQIDGDLTTDGNLNDVTLSEIKGKITHNGDILGDVHIENVSGPIHLHTSVTDLQLASLESGDLTLDSDDLKVTEAKGPVHITTHAKDVDLSQVYGDSTVQNRDGSISIEPAGAYAIDARNSKGDIEITLPSNAAGTVDGRTHNGDILTDFGLAVSGDEDKTVAGRIGSGGPKIYLSSDNGDLRIKKGSSAFPAAPPAAQSAPTSPSTPTTRHLKTNAPLPQQPVTQ